jgi:hypothetical protein
MSYTAAAHLKTHQALEDITVETVSPKIRILLNCEVAATSRYIPLFNRIRLLPDGGTGFVSRACAVTLSCQQFASLGAQ